MLVIRDTGDADEVERKIKEYMLNKARFAKQLSVSKVTRLELQAREDTANSLGLGYTTGLAMKFKKKADKDLF